MDARLKKRMYTFYFAGALNLVLGFWVLIYGGDLDKGARMIMMVFFFGFAAVDFWFPTQLKKKFAEQQAEFERLQREQAEASGETAEPKS